MRTGVIYHIFYFVASCVKQDTNFLIIRMGMSRQFLRVQTFPDLGYVFAPYDAKNISESYSGGAVQSPVALYHTLVGYLTDWL